MIELYTLILIAVIAFILVNMIKPIKLLEDWISLLLGDIMLFCVLFNFQYFFFGMISFYQDGRDVNNLESSIIIWFGFTCTVLSLIGIILKPEVYKRLRMAFE